MLEHLTPADRDEALAGDLIEDFRTGRTNRWYWRQAFSACATGWINYFGDRRFLVAFAILWSMLAPGWAVFFRAAVNDSSLNRLNRDWPLALLLWLAFNFVFLWGGVLVYQAFHASIGKSIPRDKISRALILAPFIFPPLYGAMAVLMNLYTFPGLKIPHGIKPFGGVADFHVWADVLRIPYCLAMVGALWGTTKSRGWQGLEAASGAIAGGGNLESGGRELTLLTEPEEWSSTRFFVFMVASGLLNASIAAWLICRLPDTYSPSMRELMTRAFFYVAATALAGVGGARFYWSRAPHLPASSAPISFKHFALASAGGWVWIPPALLLSTQNSPAAAILAGVGATILAGGLRRSIPAAPGWQPEETEMFAATLRTPPVESSGYVISICIYLAALGFAVGQNVNAGAPLAVAAFLWTWESTRAPKADEDSRMRNRVAIKRLAGVGATAVLITAFALMFGVQLRNQKAAAAAANSAASTQHQVTHGAKNLASGAIAYKSIILWPIPPKKQPLTAPQSGELLAPGSKRPLIIRFDGPYWYFQSPNKRPGPKAHQAHGDPLTLPIESNDSIPLVMEAHQNLGVAIPLSRCREIQVAIESEDNRVASIMLAMLLTDSSAPGKPELYLGQQPVIGSDADHAAASSSMGIRLVRDVLHFAVPAHARIRSFDRITVMFLTDPGHALVGPMIHIDQFALLPR
jgi:hypothetical protein